MFSSFTCWIYILKDSIFRKLYCLTIFFSPKLGDEKIIEKYCYDKYMILFLLNLI